MRFVILVIAILLIVSTPLFAFDTKGLVLYLPFDEGTGKIAKDASGSKNDGELKGKAEWVAGKYGKAINISDSGADNQVVVKDSDSLDVADQITMAAWVNIKSFVDNWNAIIGKNNTYMLHTDVEGDKKNARTDPLIWIGGQYGVWPSSAASPVPLGNWHHVAGVYDGKEIRTYVDGEMLGKVAKNGKIDATTAELGIGRDNRLPTRVCSQTIDEVMIWNRALSADEVKQIMAGGKSAFAVDVSGKLTSSWGYVKSNY